MGQQDKYVYPSRGQQDKHTQGGVVGLRPHFLPFPSVDPLSLRPFVKNNNKHKDVIHKAILLVALGTCNAL